MHPEYLRLVPSRHLFFSRSSLAFYLNWFSFSSRRKTDPCNLFRSTTTNHIFASKNLIFISLTEARVFSFPFFPSLLRKKSMKYFSENKLENHPENSSKDWTVSFARFASWSDYAKLVLSVAFRLFVRLLRRIPDYVAKNCGHYFEGENLGSSGCLIKNPVETDCPCKLMASFF